MGFRFESVVFVATILLLCSSVMNNINGVEGQTAAGGGIGDCGSQFQKLMPCLTFATGKEGAPSSECCNSVKGMQDSEPKCLCIIMQQTHNGSAQIKSLGIQEAKLIQLPSACKLQNASISFCPKILGLAPNSPDAAIFTNITSTPTATATGTGTAAPDSFGTKHKPLFFPSFIVIVLAIFTFML